MKHYLLLFLIFGLVFQGWTQIDAKKEQNPLVVFLVRHAEKFENSEDPQLSAEGEERAKDLAQTLSSADLDYIHSTDFIRTKNTAAPVAALFGLKTELYDPNNLSELKEKLLNERGRHLVVGHSNTTPEMVELLGGDSGLQIDEANEYDRLYILTIENGKVNTVLMRYGKKYSNTN